MSNIHDQFDKGTSLPKKDRKLQSQIQEVEKKVKLFSEDELKSLNYIIRRDYNHTAPKNAEELWKACKVLFNFEWPVTSASPENNAPFEWIYDYYFCRFSMMLTLASRGAGKTFGQAQVTYLQNRFKPNYDVITAAAILNQSNVSKGYLANFYEDEVLRQGFLKAPTATTAIWKNNSKWGIATGSMKGISGQHPIQLNIDEVEFWGIQDIEQTYAVPQDKNGYRKIWAGFSTRQRSFGCLPYYARIVTEDGPMKIGKIVNTKYAGKVLSLSKTGVWEWRKVTDWFKNGTTDTWYKVYTNKSSKRAQLVATGDHEVYYDLEKKKPLSEFVVGEFLLTRDKNSQVIKIPIEKIEIEKHKKPSTRFDITVEGNHNYCNGSKFLVSNCMNYMVDKATEPNSNIKLYQWNVFDIMQRCPSCLCIKGDKVVSNPEEKCFLWEDCKGVLGRKSSGWFKRVDAEGIKKTMTKEAWQTQFLCSKPSTHGLVLHNFEHAHATQSNINNGNYMAWEYQPDLPYYCVHDPAESKTSFLLFYQIWNGRIMFFDELVDDNCFNVDTVKQALEDRIYQAGYGKDPEYIVVDPHRSDAGEQWKQGEAFGRGRNKSYRVKYPDMSENNMSRIEAGIELVRTLICNGSGERRIYMNPSYTPKLVGCVKEHHYKMGADNKLYDDATPAKEGKDGVDAVRYACIYEVQVGKLGYKGIGTFIMF